MRVRDGETVRYVQLVGFFFLPVGLIVLDTEQRWSAHTEGGDGGKGGNHRWTGSDFHASYSTAKISELTIRIESGGGVCFCCSRQGRCCIDVPPA